MIKVKAISRAYFQTIIKHKKNLFLKPLSTRTTVCTQNIEGLDIKDLT
jgi:hypothetical protein